jgi:hypothetical protein
MYVKSQRQFGRLSTGMFSLYSLHYKNYVLKVIKITKFMNLETLYVCKYLPQTTKLVPKMSVLILLHGQASIKRRINWSIPVHTFH